MATKKATAAKATSKTSKSKTAAKPKTKVTTKTASASSKVSRITNFNLSRMPIVGASVAELIGTFLLVVMVLITRGEPIYILFALVGIGMMTAVASGTHVNPAVTIGAWVTRKISGIRAASYVLSQALGAMLAFVVVSAFVSAAPEVSEEAAMFGQQATQIFAVADLPDGKVAHVFLAELLGLTVLGFAYASALNLRRRGRILSYSMSIGAAVFVALILASGLASYVQGPAVLNPATAISVQALSMDNLSTLLVYVVAPILGGVIGFTLQGLVSTEDDSKKVTA